MDTECSKQIALKRLFLISTITKISIVRHAVKTTQALVIGMEGYHPISKMYDLRERGIRLCLQKPINYNDVRKAISKIGLHDEAIRVQFAVRSSVA
jgi:hypothetical protein